jgi:ent-kaurene oxidase
LLTETKHLSELEMEQLLWEPIPLSTDTSMVTTEWIMFELAKNPTVQERLYKEIIDVTCGQDQITTRMVKEDDIPNMPYLSAVIKETFRKYPPIPLLPSRYVNKDTTLGGYDIPKGWQVGDILIY